MNNNSMASLVEQAICGDPKAFAKIYAKFSRSVYYLGLRMTKNEYDANDVVQETMLRLYESLSKIKNPASISSFVNTTAYNCCIDIIRKTKNDFITDDEALEDISVSNKEFIPEKYLESEELRKSVIDIIDNLSADQRSAIMLFYYEELPINKIAEITDVSQQVVKTRLWRARNAIKEKLGTNTLKEVFVFAMATPVLTKLLNVDSKASFTKDVSSLNWEHLAEKLSYSPDVVASTINIANSGVASTVAAGSIAATSATTIASKIGIGKIVSIIAAATIATGSLGYGAYSYFNKDIAESNVIENSVDKTINLAPDFSQNEDLEIPLVSSSQADIPSSSDTGGVISKATTLAEPAVSSENFIINVNQYFLTYPVGSNVSAEQIVSDAQITKSLPVNVSLSYFDKVDFDKPGEYAIYLIAEDDNGKLLSQNVIIITVQEKPEKNN